ncbi:hypothetical protein OUZ56_008584 [Daphnia magna]|uniref:Uncharacterized protein n=1 Tax=Daphnia magna TaxID=35525 RepID=A0ABR0ADT7_9CRUS|nr:hypothetical protein OUZ56_008584 [Daphnia magna]
MKPLNGLFYSLILEKLERQKSNDRRLSKLKGIRPVQDRAIENGSLCWYERDQQQPRLKIDDAASLFLLDYPSPCLWSVDVIDSVTLRTRLTASGLREREIMIPDEEGKIQLFEGMSTGNWKNCF